MIVTKFPCVSKKGFSYHIALQELSESELRIVEKEICKLERDLQMRFSQ